MYENSSTAYMHIYIYNHQQHHHNNLTLHTISHNSSKREKYTNYDKHHTQHLSLNHTSTFNYIKLFMKDLQGNRTQRLNPTTFVSYFTTLKQL